MEYNFKEWLKGLVEDDPLPQEIKYICFIISCKKDRVELSVTGSENPFFYAVPDMYYPLEAECFFCPKYFKMRPNSRDEVFDITEKLITDFFCQEAKNLHFRPNGRTEFANITISMGFRGKKAKFLVKV